MGLLSSFKRAPGATPATVDDPQAVDAARVRARRRLIGAVVLLGIGVIAFPLLFETQPRPIPVDIAIEIPRKETAPPLVLPPMVALTKPASAPAAAAPAKPETTVATKPEFTVETKAEPKPGNKPAAQVAAVTELPSKAAASAVDAATGRYVVQVGAFADAAGARGARAKVELLGLRTYTQAVETTNGTRTRVRIGPFGSREEADRAASKLKAAGMPAAVLTL